MDSTFWSMVISDYECYTDDSYARMYFLFSIIIINLWFDAIDAKWINFWKMIKFTAKSGKEVNLVGFVYIIA